MARSFAPSGRTRPARLAQRRYPVRRAGPNPPGAAVEGPGTGRLEKALAKFENVYAQDAASAEKLLSVGESKRDNDLPAGELASWMLVASAAMNLDAVLNK